MAPRQTNDALDNPRHVPMTPRDALRQLEVLGLSDEYSTSCMETLLIALSMPRYPAKKRRVLRRQTRVAVLNEILFLSTQDYPSHVMLRRIAHHVDKWPLDRHDTARGQRRPWRSSLFTCTRRPPHDS